MNVFGLKSYGTALLVGCLLIAIHIGGSSVAAQDPCINLDKINKLYAKFTDNVKTAPGSAARRVAQRSAAQFLDQYSKCGIVEEQVEFLERFLDRESSFNDPSPEWIKVTDMDRLLLSAYPVPYKLKLKNLSWNNQLKRGENSPNEIVVVTAFPKSTSADVKLVNCDSLSYVVLESIELMSNGQYLSSGPVTNEAGTLLKESNNHIPSIFACSQVKSILGDVARVKSILEHKPKSRLDYMNDLKAATNRFDEAVKDANSVDIDAAFAAGKEILAIKPDHLDVVIALAAIGHRKTLVNPPNTKYNVQTVEYAESALELLDSGVATVNGSYGIFGFSFKTTEFPDGKANTIGWMNYIIGDILYRRENKRKEALPFLNRSISAKSETKVNPIPYALIGEWYLSELTGLMKQITTVPKEKKEALFKSLDFNLDQSLIAFAKAYALAKPSDYKNALRNQANNLYQIKFEKVEGFDEYLASAAERSLALDSGN